LENVQKVKKFNHFEKLLFKVTLGILGIAISLFIITLVVVTQIYSIPKLLIDLTTSILMIAIANFFLSMVRIFKYLIKISKLENNIGIMRSIISLLISPISAALLLILIIMMSLSGCTIQ